MSRTVWVPDFSACDSLYQPVEVPEPGDPGYPASPLPDADPWAPAVNQAIAEIKADREAEAEEWGPHADLELEAEP
jgi:hypothetical protein